MDILNCLPQITSKKVNSPEIFHKYNELQFLQSALEFLKVLFFSPLPRCTLFCVSL